MPFRDIAASPEELERLARAFDAAWISVNQSKPTDPLERSAARERLGCIIIGLWEIDPHQEIADAAAEAFLGGALTAQKGRTSA